MKASIITVCHNSADTLRDAIESVQKQTHQDVEYIIIDGASSDDTLALLENYRGGIDKLLSEPDDGMYDAMNKGLEQATGDFIGILNSDDFYASTDVIMHVAECFISSGADIVYGDLQYVSQTDVSRVVRQWQSCPYEPNLFRRGWHPPHPSFFVRREVYEQYGNFKSHLKIAADFELMLRFLEKHHVASAYLPEVMVKMRTGGASNRSLKNIVRANYECYRAWKMNDLPASIFNVARKPLSKLPQFFHFQKEKTVQLSER